MDEDTKDITRLRTRMTELMHRAWDAEARGLHEDAKMWKKNVEETRKEISRRWRSDGGIRSA